jgi:hypothetical protein
MRSQFFTVALLTFSIMSASQLRAADARMGDWKGTVTLSGREQPVAVYMIPLGDNRYEARAVADFQKRGPYLFRLRGLMRGDQFRFMDDVPLDAASAVGTTERGVIFPASLWSGTLSDGGVKGAIAGKSAGSFQLSQSKRTSPNLGKTPPDGAVVLFDGGNLDRWRSRDGQKPKWKILAGGVMEVNGGDIMTTDKFGDQQLHLEFRLPYMPNAFGQGRANSGVYPQGRYEVQVLDSYGLEGADNECGGIYQVSRPSVNMCLPPLEWQSYDITFYSAKVDANGRKTANARITVVHNGVTVQDNVELPRVTGGAIDEREGVPGPLILQDHSNPVQYRNIWIRPL